jgi:hypothetical protein
MARDPVPVLIAQLQYLAVAPKARLYVLSKVSGEEIVVRFTPNNEFRLTLFQDKQLASKQVYSSAKRAVNNITKNIEQIKRIVLVNDHLNKQKTELVVY